MNPNPLPGNPQSVPFEPTPARTSRLAIASLILGLLGFLILPALAGLVCGIVGMVAVQRSAGALKGFGLALAGTIVSVLMLALIPVMAIVAGITLPALAKAKSKAQTIMSMNNVKQLNLAALLYSSDSNDTFPAATNWCEALQPYIGGNQKVFLRPEDQQSDIRSSYGFNAALAGRKTPSVNPQTVLVFELQTGGWNQTGGPELLRHLAHPGDSVVVGFADGHSEPITSESRLSSLRWEP